MRQIGIHSHDEFGRTRQRLAKTVHHRPAITSLPGTHENPSAWVFEAFDHLGGSIRRVVIYHQHLDLHPQPQNPTENLADVFGLIISGDHHRDPGRFLGCHRFIGVSGSGRLSFPYLSFPYLSSLTSLPFSRDSKEA